MAHKKGAGSTRNGRDSAGQRLAVAVNPAIWLAAGEGDGRTAADHDAFNDGLAAIQGGFRGLHP